MAPFLYDCPQGESARQTSLVVLEGWSKVSPKEALTEMAVTFLDNSKEAPPSMAVKENYKSQQRVRFAIAHYQ